MRERLDLSGRVAVITGASRGIGAAVAETLAERGMSLVLGGHSRHDQLTARADAIATTHGTRVEICFGDIADPQTSVDLAKTAFDAHRRLDVWVNNAGLMMDSLIGMVSDSSIEKTLAVNLGGVLHGIQQAARVMARGKGGSIVNLASIIGRYGNAGQLVYSASKAGVIGATLSAAKELAAKRIRVNAIAPGFIDTDMVKQLAPDKFAARLESIAMGRIGTPEDIADCVLFLASDLSRYITGQIIGVDGGMVI